MSLTCLVVTFESNDCILLDAAFWVSSEWHFDGRKGRWRNELIYGRMSDPDMDMKGLTWHVFELLRNRDVWQGGPRVSVRG